jgi:hypothetical protein
MSTTPEHVQRRRPKPGGQNENTRCIVFFRSNLAIAPGLFAGDNISWLSAPPRDDVWVIVYDADADGTRGEIIWEGKIAAGQETKIFSPSGFIRYSFWQDKDQPYEGDLPFGCYQNRTIRVD